MIIKLRDKFSLEGYLKILASNNNFVEFNLSKTDGGDEFTVTMGYEDDIPKIIELLKEGLWHYKNTCCCSAFSEDECGCGNYGNIEVYEKGE